MRSLPSLALSLLLLPTSTSAAELAMGLRVGEVTHDSAIVWIRVTRDKDRVNPGYRDPCKQEPRENDFTPPTIPVEVPDQRLIAIQALEPQQDNALMDELLASNPSFRPSSPQAKSKFVPRNPPFTPV